MVDSISQIASAFDSAREYTFEAAAVATSKLGESSYTQYSKNITQEQLKILLNSRSTREIKDGIKRIIALMASDDDSIPFERFFADVVKNIVSDDIKVKQLVCVYLLRFAEKEPNLALLPVNSIQKTLTDIKPELRSFSIKALSDIKIPSLYPMVIHCLKKAVTDPSGLVRCEVSFGLLKLYKEKQQELEEEILIILKNLLSDADPQVISSAILLLRECFPDRLDLLHGHFRHYTKILRELDDFSQSYLIELLIKYCKLYLPKPTIVDSSSSNDEQNTIPLPDKYNEIIFPVYDIINHPDLELFLYGLEKLIYSSNPAVVLSCCNAFYQLATPSQLKKSYFLDVIVKLFVTSNNLGVKNSLLQSILLFSTMDQTLFLPHLRKFFLLDSDTVTIKCLKLKVLSALTNESNVKFIAKEIKYYITTAHTPEVVIAASNSLAACAKLSVGWEAHVMKWFIESMESRSLPASVLDSYINIIRLLVQNNPKRHLKIIVKLSQVLETQNSLADNARAGIVWLFGEIAAVEFRICPDVLRKLIPTFSLEGPEARCQILLLAAKLLSYDIDSFKEETPITEISDLENRRIYQMYNAVLYLAKFDDDFDIRDRARCISSIFDSGKYEIATLLFQAPKSTPGSSSIIPSSDDSDLDTTTLELTTLGIDKSIQEYHKLIQWNPNLEESSEDIREPIPLKDYSKTKKSFSSSSFVSSRSSNTRAFQASPSPTSQEKSTKSFTSTQGKKYHLQSLDEFLSDVPAKTKPPKKRIIIQEESTSEEETTDEEDDDEESSEEESGDETSSSLSSSEVGVTPE